MRSQELTLREFSALFWGCKGWIASVTVAMTALAVGAAWLVPKEYLARTVISPVSRDSRGAGLGSALEPFGELVALAGGAPTKAEARAEAIATLRSDVLTERYITEQDLIPVFYHRKWSTWRKEPTLWQANEYFSRRIRGIADDKKTGLVTVTITWADPVHAAKWANDLVRLTNDYMRQKAIHTAQADLAYLEEQAQTTATVEMRRVVYTLMQTELKNEMKASGDQEFAFKVIDPATVAEKPASPKTVVWGLGGFGSGLLGSLMFALVHRDRGRST